MAIAAGLVVLAATVGGLSALPASNAEAATCSIGTPQGISETMLRDVQVSDLVFVGTVTDERRQDGLYESTVRPDAWLRGEAPEEAIRVPFLGGELGADCSGNPRLEKGERVLLSLTRKHTAHLDGARVDTWQLGSVFSKILIREDGAYSETANSTQRIGEADATVRELAAASGATEAEIEAAVAAANAPVDPALSDDPGGSWRWLAVAGVGGMVVLLVVLRSRKRRLARD